MAMSSICVIVRSDAKDPDSDITVWVDVKAYGWNRPMSPTRDPAGPPAQSLVKDTQKLVQDCMMQGLANQGFGRCDLCGYWSHRSTHSLPGICSLCATKAAAGSADKDKL